MVRFNRDKGRPLDLYKIMMHSLISLFISLFLVLQSFSGRTYAEEISISDLLIPEVPSMSSQAEKLQKLEQGSKDERNLDELLGPKDIFPFLPDNHRDSGTGKFNPF